MVTGSTVSPADAEAHPLGSELPSAAITSTSTQRMDVRRSYADGALSSLMVGFGESYISAFALAIGRSQVSSGLLSTLPLVFGGIFQLVTPRLSRAFPGHRTWVVRCATLHGLVYAPLLVFALLGWAPFPALFALASIYWGFGMAAGSVWNNWIDAIIPRERLTRFFAVRSRITQLASFVAFFAAGVFLDHAGGGTKPFAALFAAALVCRLVSVHFLRQQSDVTGDRAAKPPAPLRLAETLRHFRNPQSGRFLVYMLVMQVSLNLGSPFFTPYMLAQLKFSYAEYTAIVAGAYVSKILFYPAIAAVVQRLGPFRSLWLSGLTVAVPPLLWFLTPQLWVLIALQLVAGFTWGIFELASTLLIFDRIHADQRISVLSIYNLLNACAVSLGSVAGGLLLAQGDIGDRYPLIFSLSAAARLLSLVALVRVGTALATMSGGAKSVVIALRAATTRPARGADAEPAGRRVAGDEHRP